jgi:hypothetical protein
MPSILHDEFIRLVERKTRQSLKDLAKSSDCDDRMRSAIKKIQPVYGMQHLREEVNRQSDLISANKGAVYPSVVIEVAYSQKKDELKYIAEDYILLTGGDTQIVIPLNLEYNGLEASISIWCPERKIVNGEETLRVVQELEDQVRVMACPSKNSCPASAASPDL